MKNPYKGHLERAIEYGIYGLNFPLVEKEGGGTSSKIIYVYEKTAKDLAIVLSTPPSSQILEIGCGTGTSTLEMFQEKERIFITAIDESLGAINLAKYKFNQKKLDYGEQHIPLQLRDYWKQFREKSKRFTKFVKFIKGNFEEIDLKKKNEFDGAFANQSMHWMDLDKYFSQINRYLKKGGVFAWNTCSEFYDDAKFPNSQYCFKQNYFFECLLGELEKRINYEKKPLEEVKFSIGKLREISKRYGFETKQIGTYLIALPLQTFLKEYPKLMVNEQITHTLSEKELDTKINEVLREIIIRPEIIKDTERIWEIVPVFISKKLKETG